MKWLSGKVLVQRVKNWVWISKSQCMPVIPAHWRGRDKSILGACCPTGVTKLVTSRLSLKLRWRATEEDTLTFDLRLHMHTCAHPPTHTYTHKTKAVNRTDIVPVDCLLSLWLICKQSFQKVPKIGEPMLSSIYQWWPWFMLTWLQFKQWHAGDLRPLLGSLLGFGSSVPYLMMSLFPFIIVSEIVWWHFKAFLHLIWLFIFWANSLSQTQLLSLEDPTDYLGDGTFYKYRKENIIWAIKLGLWLSIFVYMMQIFFKRSYLAVDVVGSSGSCHGVWHFLKVIKASFRKWGHPVKCAVLVLCLLCWLESFGGSGLWFFYFLLEALWADNAKNPQRNITGVVLIISQRSTSGMAAAFRLSRHQADQHL